MKYSRGAARIGTTTSQRKSAVVQQISETLTQVMQLTASPKSQAEQRDSPETECDDNSNNNDNAVDRHFRGLSFL
jgi:hypothetical protein